MPEHEAGPAVKPFETAGGRYTPFPTHTAAPAAPVQAGDVGCCPPAIPRVHPLLPALEKFLPASDTQTWMRTLQSSLSTSQQGEKGKKESYQELENWFPVLK